MPLVLGPEDLTPGMFITIHRGHCVSCPCGCGGCGPESYEKIKGMPLVVRGICLPYVATAIVPVGIPAVIDVRECELMRLDEAYLRAFLPGHFPPPEQQTTPPQPEQIQQPPPQQEPTANGPV